MIGRITFMKEIVEWQQGVNKNPAELVQNLAELWNLLPAGRGTTGATLPSLPSLCEGWEGNPLWWKQSWVHNASERSPGWRGERPLRSSQLSSLCVALSCVMLLCNSQTPSGADLLVRPGEIIGKVQNKKLWAPDPLPWGATDVWFSVGGWPVFPEQEYAGQGYKISKENNWNGGEKHYKHCWGIYNQFGLKDTRRSISPPLPWVLPSPLRSALQNALCKNKQSTDIFCSKE